MKTNRKIKQFSPPDPDKAEKEEKEPLKDLDEYPELKRDKKRLENAVDRYSAIHQQAKALEEQKKELATYIMGLFEKNDVERVRINGHPVRIVKTGHTTLSKEMLIEKGVNPKIIAQCEQWVPHADHVRVDAKKKE